MRMGDLMDIIIARGRKGSKERLTWRQLMVYYL